MTNMPPLKNSYEITKVVPGFSRAISGFQGGALTECGLFISQNPVKPHTERFTLGITSNAGRRLIIPP